MACGQVEVLLARSPIIKAHPIAKRQQSPVPSGTGSSHSRELRLSLGGSDLPINGHRDLRHLDGQFEIDRERLPTEDSGLAEPLSRSHPWKREFRTGRAAGKAAT